MNSSKSCSHTELTARVVAIEAGFIAFKDLMAERDLRYAQRSKSQDEAVAAALQTSEKAIVKAESATEKRFENVNEFRETLSDQSATLLSRTEYQVQHQALLDKLASDEKLITLLRTDIVALQTRGGSIKDMWGYIIGLGGLALVALDLYFHH